MIRRYLTTAAVLAAAAISAAVPAAATAQLPRIGIIDLYGLRKTKAAQVREAIGINVGDSLSALAMFEIPARLADIPGVTSAAIDPVCCEEGKTMLYVGVLEEGAPALELRAPPTGTQRVPAEVEQAGIAFARAHNRAVMRGFVREDISQGHSLMADSAARMIQLGFVDLAAKYGDSLRAVLRNSNDSDHRALAAEVLAYAANKQSVVDDLVYGMRDPASDVRNNATRALALIAAYAQANPALKITVPYEPFIDLLNSIAWTDRNKASLALMQLTEKREPALLTALKTRAFDSLVDIAEWTNPGHSMAGLVILGRIGGLPDADIFAMFERGEKEKITAAARK